jgi:hypothetical protein
MTLSKSSTNYRVQDTIEDVNVNGTVVVGNDGTINISINTDNGGYASYTRGVDGFINFNSSFNEANDLIDYVQTLISDIRISLDNNQ